MNKFYTCKNDRTFKEVFLNPNNSDLLKALLEVILKIKIDKLEIKKTELLSGNVNIRDKRVDALVYTGNKKIEIEINSENKLLMVLGIVEIEEDILKIGAKPMQYNRTPEYKETLKEIFDGLQYLFQTKQPVLLVSSSGTGVM